MKDDRKKIKEPFEPDETPKPPQQVEPGQGQKRDNPVGEKRGKKSEPQSEPQNKQSEKTGKEHLLSDETEIDDDTTI